MGRCAGEAKDCSRHAGRDPARSPGKGGRDFGWSQGFRKCFDCTGALWNSFEMSAVEIQPVSNVFYGFECTSVNCIDCTNAYWGIDASGSREPPHEPAVRASGRTVSQTCLHGYRCFTECLHEHVFWWHLFLGGPTPSKLQDCEKQCLDCWAPLSSGLGSFFPTM